MKNFSYSRAETVEGAVSLLSQQANAKFLGGGTNLVDLMRENIEQPDALIDVTGLTSIRGRAGSAELPGRRDFDRRRGAEQRGGEQPSGARPVSRALPGDFVRRIRTNPKYGDHRGKPDATHPVLLLLRRSFAMQ